MYDILLSYYVTLSHQKIPIPWQTGMGILEAI